MLTREEKEKIVKEIINIFKTYSTIGFVDFYKLGTREYRELKKELKNKINFEIKFFKRSLVLKALEFLNREELKKYLPNQVGILFSNENPLKIYKEIKKVYKERFAKPNDIAEEDIIIKPMITNIPAGPSIAEFQKFKIEVGVEQGKIAIKKEKLLVKKGEKISSEIASILQKLGIKPIKVRLNLTCLIQDSMIFPKDVLELDEEYYSNEIKKAFLTCLKICEKIEWFNIYNIKNFIIKAKRIKNEICEKIEIFDKESLENSIKKHILIAEKIKSLLNI